MKFQKVLQKNLQIIKFYSKRKGFNLQHKRNHNIKSSLKKIKNQKLQYQN